MIGKNIDLSLVPHTGTNDEKQKMSYTIVGVMEKPSYDWMVDNAIHMDKEQKAVWVENLSTDSNMAEDELFYSEFNIYADTLENVKSILEKLKDKGYSVYSVTEQLDQMNVFFLS